MSSAGVRDVTGSRLGDRASAFEVRCRDCGDNPYLNYSEVPPGFSVSADLTRRAGAAQPTWRTWT